jgi:hypothetical protein
MLHTVIPMALSVAAIVIAERRYIRFYPETVRIYLIILAGVFLGLTMTAVAVSQAEDRCSMALTLIFCGAVLTWMVVGVSALHGHGLLSPGTVGYKSWTRLFAPTQIVSCQVARGSSLADRLQKLGVQPHAISERHTGHADSYRAVSVSVDLMIPTRDGESLEMTDEGLRIATRKREIPSSFQEYWKTARGVAVSSEMVMDSGGHTGF